MASSLGTLTLDLVSRIGSFTEGLDKAGRHAQKKSKEMQRAADEVKKAWSNIGKTIAAGLAGISVKSIYDQMAENSKMAEQEQVQLAAVLKSTGEVAGYTQDQLNKMADSMSDLTGIAAGEFTKAQTRLAEFTGIIGNNFPRALQAATDMSVRMGMSVTQAMELVGRALDVPSQGLAALSRQGFRFTDDQKLLVKHLEDTGRAAEAQAIILEALETTYGGAAEAARNTYAGALEALKTTLGGLMTGDAGSLNGARDMVEDLNRALKDPEVQAAIKSVTNALMESVNAIPYLLNAVDGFTRVVRIAANTLVGFFASQAGNIRWLAAQVEGALSHIGMGDMDKARALLKEAGQQEQIARMANAEIDRLMETELLGDRIKRVAAETKGIKADALKIDQEAEIAAAKAAAAAAKASKAAKAKRDEGDKAAEAIARELTAIERAAKVWGMTADEVKLYDLRIMGANEHQLAHADAILKSITLRDEEKKLLENYQGVVKSLRTQDESRLDTLREQLSIIQQMGSEDQNKQAGRALAGIMDASPEFAGVGEIAGGFTGEFGRLDKAEQQLNEWYAKQLGMVQQFREEYLNYTAEADEKERLLHQEHARKLQAIDKARQIAGLNMASDFFGNLAQLQNSQNAKAAALGKAAAITQAVIKTYEAANAAYASAAATPVIGHILGPLAAGAAIAAGMANVAAIRGMAHDGIDSVPQTGTWLLEKGERVTTAQTSAKLDNVLSSIQGSQQSQQSAPPVVNLNAVNVLDPSLVGDYLSTPEGEQVLINTIRRNPDQVRQVVNHG